MTKPKYKKGEILIEHDWLDGSRIVEIKYHGHGYDNRIYDIVEYGIKYLDGSGRSYPKIKDFERKARRLTKKEKFIFYINGYEIVEEDIRKNRKKFNIEYLKELASLSDYSKEDIDYILKHLKKLIKGYKK